MAEVTEVRDLAPETKSVIKQAMLGPGMQKLTMQRESAYLDLKNSGRLKPATVININPVSLVVEDGHVPWRVPAATDKNKKGIIIEHGGKKYEAAFMTVKEPSFVPWIRDVHKPSDEGENPNADYDAKFILPIELMNQYYINYTQPQFIKMGGVIVIEGDIHSFLKSQTILVPDSTRLPDGTRSYFSKAMDKSKVIAASLEMQKTFCTGAIQQGDEYNQDDINRKNITSVHRIWAQYALDMGWKKNAPVWMSADLESDDACIGCGKAKTRTDAHFCECGRPFNAYSSFMMGENVPDSYLYALKGKELEDVMKEMHRREDIKAKFKPKA